MLNPSQELGSGDTWMAKVVPVYAVSLILIPESRSCCIHLVKPSLMYNCWTPSHQVIILVLPYTNGTYLVTDALSPGPLKFVALEKYNKIRTVSICTVLQGVITAS